MMLALRRIVSRQNTNIGRRSSQGVRCWMTKSTTWNPRRNAMQQFIAKFKDQIQGVMYGFDRVLFRGSMRARIQTWFPFYIHVCIHGREWLSRRMDREGLRYFRQENCFPWVEDIPRAQPLFQEQLQVNWADLLQPFAQRLNPLHEEIFRNYPTEYYWSGFQCEWATDIRSVRVLSRGCRPYCWNTGC